MNGMGREANQLLSAGRQAFSPTHADRVRVMAALAGTATLSIGAAAAAGVAERTWSGILSTLPARVVALALPLAAGAYGWQAVQESAPAAAVSARPAARAPAVVTPKIVEPPVPEAAARVEELPSEPTAPAPERSGAPTIETPKAGVEIRQEVALLSRAQAALSRGRPQEALEALSEHAQRFPRGALLEERAATRARTLCALGRRQEAESELKRMERLNPNSAYLARARESCGSR